MHPIEFVFYQILLGITAYHHSVAGIVVVAIPFLIRLFWRRYTRFMTCVYLTLVLIAIISAFMVAVRGS